MKLSHIFGALLFFLLVGIPSTTNAILTNEQELWLNKLNKTIIVYPEKNFPPFSFSGQNQRPQGISIDYIELVVKKIGATLQYTQPESRSVIVSNLKEEAKGVAITLTKTSSREDFLYFTDPYFNIPAVIVIRKDYPTKRGGYTLGDFTGKRIAVGDTYAVEDYIKSNYKKIILDPVTNDEIGIQKVLLGEVDAAVMDIASFSYYTANNALSYVEVGGQTGFEYNLAFSVSKKNPELYQLVSEGLKAITPAEKQIITEKWITQALDIEPRSVYQFSGNNTLLIVASVIAGALLFFISIILIVRAINRIQVLSVLGTKKNSDITKKDTELETLKTELEKLEEASEVVSDELAQIKKLEKDIADKIEKID